MRIVHISDLHFWHITLNPRRLMGKRLLGMGNLILNRARNFKMEAMTVLAQRVQELKPDHVLVTGDLTTTSLDEEFQAARRALAPLASSSSFLTVIPGNHDRYTRDSERNSLFEKHFAEFAPSASYPWLKPIGQDTAILGLDPCHSNPISARGTISAAHLQKAAALLDEARSNVKRLLVACHYPVAVPDGIVDQPSHGLGGSRELQDFLIRYSPAVYCHGHIHAVWGFCPPFLPQTLCLNPGAALKRRKHTGVGVSLLEIVLTGPDVEVRRHLLRRETWETGRLFYARDFLNRRIDS
jgi:3',5'-cyclic AMP phosphodiesterase CpdA